MHFCHFYGPIYKKMTFLLKLSMLRKAFEKKDFIRVSKNIHMYKETLEST